MTPKRLLHRLRFWRDCGRELPAEVDRRLRPLEKAGEKQVIIDIWVLRQLLTRPPRMAAERPTMLGLIKTLWLQFGPFMRVVYGRFGTAGLIDQHSLALEAISKGQADVLAGAIATDINDGMALIVRDIGRP